MMLASCTASPFPSPGPAPGSFSPGDRPQVEITSGGEFIPAPGSGSLTGGQQISLIGLQACDFAYAVFRDTLSMDVGCAAQGGSLSMIADGSGSDLAQIGRAVLTRAGFGVTFDGQTVLVEGVSEGGSAAGVSGETLGDGGQNVQGVEAFTVARAEYGSISGSLPIGPFDRLNLPGAEPEVVVEVADELGVPVLVVPGRAGLSVFGLPDDLSVIQSIIDARDAVVVLPVSGVDQAILQGVVERFPVAIDIDGPRGIASVSGDPLTVRQAVEEIRALSGDQRDVAIQVSFWRGDTSHATSFGLTPGVAFDAGSFAVSLGVSELADVSVIVEHLADATRTTAEMHPAVAVSPGGGARFQSGQDVPVLASVGEDGQQSIEYRAVGAIVDAVVHPLPGGLYIVDLTVEVSAIDGFGVADNPIIGTRQITTSVTLSRGDLVFLSGFEASSLSDTRGTNALFPNRSSSNAQESLSFLLSLR